MGNTCDQIVQNLQNILTVAIDERYTDREPGACPLVETHGRCSMIERSITELRRDISDLVTRVAFGGERVLIRRNGKAVAAIIAAVDLETLEAMEDRRDLDIARRALAEHAPRVTHEDLMRSLDREAGGTTA